MAINHTFHPETKAQAPVAIYYSKRDEDRMIDMHHRLFNLRRPIDMSSLELTLDGLKAAVPAITEMHVFHAISPTVLTIQISTDSMPAWTTEKIYNDPQNPGNTLALVEFVTSSLQIVVANSPIDPRLNI